MHSKSFKDVISLSGFKINPVKTVNQAKNSGRPVLLTSYGRGVAVVQGLEEYQRNDEELAFIKAVAQGLIDIELRKTFSLNEAKKRFGI